LPTAGLHQIEDNVAQARGPKIRPKLGVSCRRLHDTCLIVNQPVASRVLFGYDPPSPKITK
jgi:hypothetical protein